MFTVFVFIISILVIECLIIKYYIVPELNKITSSDVAVLKVKKLTENAVIPSYAHEGDIGMDFTAIGVEYDKEKDLYRYHTGLASESKYLQGEFIFPRSSNCKTDAYLCNSVGVVDSSIYRGEIMFCFKNRTSINTRIMEIAMEETFLQCKKVSDFAKIYEKVKNDLIENRLEEIAMGYAPYNVGDRIGQLIMLNHPKTEIVEVEELSSSVRGEGGFGSTGK